MHIDCNVLRAMVLDVIEIEFPNDVVRHLMQ